MSENKRIEEMANTMKAAALEEMKAELEQAGYAIRIQYRGSFINLPFDENIGGVIIQSYNNDTGSMIKYAYAHLQKERQHAALLEFVKNAQNYDTSGENGYLDDADMCCSFWNWFQSEAKRLLGE